LAAAFGKPSGAELMSINLKSLESDEKFEKLCNELLMRLLPDLQPVDGRGGDGGLDSFTGKLFGELHVYQYKYFTDAINKKKHPSGAI